ncbi:MAG: response regulator [Candidatus Korobacteraceae bacterium]
MPNSSKPQILFVDDEPGVRATMGTLLVSAGYDVAMADNGVSAVPQLNRTVPDLIVTDLNEEEDEEEDDSDDKEEDNEVEGYDGYSE